jgi:hypothetical protein
LVNRQQEVTSVRQAAAVCNVTPPVVRRGLSLGLISGPPRTLQQLQQIRDETDPQGRRRGPQVAHGTLTRWLEGCDCEQCRKAQNDAARERFRRKALERLPAEMRQQLVDAIYSGQPFRATRFIHPRSGKEVDRSERTVQDLTERALELHNNGMLVAEDLAERVNERILERAHLVPMRPARYRIRPEKSTPHNAYVRELHRHRSRPDDRHLGTALEVYPRR